MSVHEALIGGMPIPAQESPNRREDGLPWFFQRSVKQVRTADRGPELLHRPAEIFEHRVQRTAWLGVMVQVSRGENAVRHDRAYRLLQVKLLIGRFRTRAEEAGHRNQFLLDVRLRKLVKMAFLFQSLQIDPLLLIYPVKIFVKQRREPFAETIDELCVLLQYFRADRELHAGR